MMQTNNRIGFTEEDPALAEKREKAMRELGDKWLLATLVQRQPRDFILNEKMYERKV